MPSDALVGAGAVLGGEALNAVLTGARNKKAYERSIAFWKMQNVYNSPEEQMKRFQRAGLSPHLIYGNGSNATNASPVPMPDIEAQKVNLGGAASAYYDTRQKTLMSDNLQAQNTVLLEEALLKKAQAFAAQAQGRAALANAGLGSYTTKVGGDMDMAQISADFKKANLDAVLQNMVKVGNQEPLQTKGLQLLNSLREGQLDQQIQSLRLIKQNILNAEQRNRLAQFEETLNKSGVSRGDAVYFRLISKLLESLGLDADSLMR